MLSNREFAAALFRELERPSKEAIALRHRERDLQDEMLLVHERIGLLKELIRLEEETSANRPTSP
jgi:hypothetical protein